MPNQPQIHITDPDKFYTTGWLVREKYPAHAIKMYPVAIVECAQCGAWWVSKRDGIHTTEAHEQYAEHRCAARRTA